MADALARLSIVVPVGPGERDWPPLLEALRTRAAAAQILPVFADGDTQTTPPDALRAPAGRAQQQNAGADAATRDWLWFLHADTALTPQALPALRAWLLRDEPALGWFRLRFADDGPPAMRLNACGANWRASTLGLPFGDQGLVLPRMQFMQLGGFDASLPFGEDHALVWRVRRAGVPLHAVDATLVTSARKYAQHGWVRTTLHHLYLTARQAWQEALR